MGSENDNQTQPDVHMCQGQGDCQHLWEHDGVLVKGAGQEEEEGPRGPAGGHQRCSAPLGSTTWRESHLRAQGCEVHGKNTLIGFSKETTATWREGREPQYLQITP